MSTFPLALGPHLIHAHAVSAHAPTVSVSSCVLHSWRVYKAFFPWGLPSSPPLWRVSPEGRVLVETSHLRLNVPKSFSLHVVQLGPCVCSHLLQEAVSLITAEQDTDLWVQEHVTKSCIALRLWQNTSVWFSPRLMAFLLSGSSTWAVLNMDSISWRGP